MPKQVDHESRRRQIAEAVCRLADESGLEGVTLRDVAARAEVSMGAVQRCFRTKEEMLVFALTYIGERIAARVTTRLVESPAQSARTALGHATTEIALLREEHRAEARVWLAFLAQAAVSPPLAEILRSNYASLQTVFTRLIAEAGGDTGGTEGADGTGAARGKGSHDPECAARTLLALADGLTAHVLIGHLSPDTALAVLDAHLGGLWGE
ncbi:TetR/AcrR family transcriptional regulator [Streptomyces piniterrae]|uniref:TetR/AcrR family transcriptional regulator n=1 Tax=Streptomyces piniterrae TaxID=2571125 RepID=A0A4U0MLT3_9ACTN|nr:TetR/AcrR family transcriptional regulator [Streptomyces piniterrae]TJZ41607.1 TetR/AcrR family transcriptional regulator [Streptomyces piniterrae]